MRRNYERTRIVVDQNLAEGVYLASGQKTGSLDVSYLGAMDKWNGGVGAEIIFRKDGSPDVQRSRNRSDFVGSSLESWNKHR